MRKVTTLLVALCATTALWAAFTPAAFSIAEGKQVYFSQGNLQYTQSNTTWSFAENQYEMLGDANVSSGNLADKIDLFGWSANNETAKWGISTSKNNTDYSGDFVDWGTNIIGTNAANTYRTLTNDEWEYLLNTRTNASEKYGAARIKLSDTQYANGLILLPDSWDCADVEFKSGLASESSEQAYADHQTFTLADWQKLEAAGAVFLPASGYRDGSTVGGVQIRCHYWSASAYGEDKAYYLYFSSSVACTFYNRSNGRAVRLVQDLYAVTITKPDNGELQADKAEAAEGKTVTLTVTPATGYELEVLTVKDAGDNEIKVTDNKFTMPASAVTVTATFKKTDYTITIAEGIENGEVTAVSTANYGDEVELTVTPATGYELEVLTVKDAENQEVEVTDNKFTMPASAVTVTATFKKTDYTITINEDIVNGKVSAVSTANYGDEVELTITPDEGFELEALTVKDAAGKGITVTNNKFTMPASAVTVTATFKKTDYTITIEASENGKVTAVSTANYGDEVELTITPATGYELDVLTVKKDADNQEVKLTDNKFVMPASAVTVTATFKKTDYTITIASDITNGTVSVTSGATTANYGDEVELTVTPDADFELDVLTVKDAENQEVKVIDNKFTMPASNVTISATFKAKTATAIENAKMVEIYAENGTIYGAEGMQIFTITGQNVTEMNGSLHGVYIVKLGDKAQKISVK